MSYLEIILPFSIPPTALSKTLLAQMQTPALATLLGHQKSAEQHYFDEFSRQLPHEAFLGLTMQAVEPEHSNSPPFAHKYLRDFGLPQSAGFWFCLNPVHIHVARDHLVMQDQRRLAISEQEARQLFELAHAICEEDGHSLLWGDAKHWFLRADDWAELHTASLDAASGHNMDIWLASGAQARAWRRLQNEIQMTWHAHPINQAREERGERSINSVWLHSGSAQLPATDFLMTELPYHQLAASTCKRIVLPHLSEPALNSDWGNWLAQFQKLEQDWFAPLCLALRDRKMGQIKFIFSDEQSLHIVACRAPQAWRFWRKPNLHALQSRLQTQHTP